MKVADLCWEGCNGTQYYPGVIIEYDGVNGRWLLLLDDKCYPEHWSMRWDDMRRFAYRKAPTYKDYDLHPFLPVTRPVTPDFDHTTEGIEAITADMITKLNINEDELPTDSCWRSGWQAFVLEFCNTLKGKTKCAKVEYLEDFGDEDNHDDVDGLSVDDNIFLTMLLRIY